MLNPHEKSNYVYVHTYIAVCNYCTLAIRKGLVEPCGSRSPNFSGTREPTEMSIMLKNHEPAWVIQRSGPKSVQIMPLSCC